MPDKSIIAIVDDDQSVREALKGLIRSLGYGALTFACAEDFLKSRRRRAVCCLIADVQLPGMTGLKLHQQLSASQEPIPTVLITAYPDESVRERALSAGVLAYLSKPFEEDSLLACVRSALAHARGDRR